MVETNLNFAPVCKFSGQNGVTRYVILGLKIFLLSLLVAGVSKVCTEQQRLFQQCELFLTK